MKLLSEQLKHLIGQINVGASCLDADAITTLNTMIPEVIKLERSNEQLKELIKDGISVCETVLHAQYMADLDSPNLRAYVEKAKEVVNGN